MIAGVPTDSGSIVDIKEQSGEYLVAIGKAELVVETCEAPTASTEPEVESEDTDSAKADFSQMTMVLLFFASIGTTFLTLPCTAVQHSYYRWQNRV